MEKDIIAILSKKNAFFSKRQRAAAALLKGLGAAVGQEPEEARKKLKPSVRSMR